MASPTNVDLERYVPAFLTWIANKLSRGASQHYLAVFDVGIETWRCLVLLAIHGSISAQQVSRVIGMDKASVSRCFKSMQSRGLVTIGLDAGDGRLPGLAHGAHARRRAVGGGVGEQVHPAAGLAVIRDEGIAVLHRVRHVVGVVF